MSDKKRGRPFKWNFHTLAVSERQFVEADHKKDYGKIYQAAQQAGRSVGGKFQLHRMAGGYEVERVS